MPSTAKTIAEIDGVDGDQELEMLMLDGTWMPRRILWTQDFMYMAPRMEQSILDSIPLIEIDDIRTLLENSVGDANHLHLRSPIQPKVVSVNGLSKVHPQEPSVSSNRSSASNKSVATNRSLSARHRSLSLIRAFSMRDLEPDRRATVLQLKTANEGFNSGREYRFRASSAESCAALECELKRLVNNSRRNAAIARQSFFQRFRIMCRYFFSSSICQSLIAMLVLTNFGVNVAQAQLNGRLTDNFGNPTEVGKILDLLDTIFTFAFLGELLFNIFCNGFQRFVSNKINIVDACIILISLASLGPWNIPVSILRVLRALRVIRLRELKRIMGTMAGCVIPVTSAFMLLLLVISICQSGLWILSGFLLINAIIGVAYFAEEAPEDFGYFEAAFVALFQVTSAGSWNPALRARNDDGTHKSGSVLYMATYILIVNWTLLPLSLAVLVDNFVSATSIAHQQAQAAEVPANGASSGAAEGTASEAGHEDQLGHALDPLLRAVAEEYVDEADLSRRLRRTFEALDEEGGGKMSLPQLCVGLKKLDFFPRIHLTEADLAGLIMPSADNFTPPGLRELSTDDFERLMRRQLRLFSQRRLAAALRAARLDQSGRSFAEILAIKALLASQPERQEPRWRGVPGTPPTPLRTTSWDCGGGAGGGGWRGGPADESLRGVEAELSSLLQRVRAALAKPPAAGDSSTPSAHPGLQRTDSGNKWSAARDRVSTLPAPRPAQPKPEPHTVSFLSQPPIDLLPSPQLPPPVSAPAAPGTVALAALDREQGARRGGGEEAESGAASAASEAATVVPARPAAAATFQKPSASSTESQAGAPAAPQAAPPPWPASAPGPAPAGSPQASAADPAGPSSPDSRPPPAPAPAPAPAAGWPNAAGDRAEPFAVATGPDKQATGGGAEADLSSSRPGHAAASRGAAAGKRHWSVDEGRGDASASPARSRALRRLPWPARLETLPGGNGAPAEAPTAAGEAESDGRRNMGRCLSAPFPAG